MTLADFYLLCFLVGLMLTLVFSLAGSTHVHLPHLHIHHGAHAHAPHGGGDSLLSAINITTLTAFAAWFGGAGYLATRYGLWFWFALPCAIGVGMAGAAIVFWFMARVLVSEHENLDVADFNMVGTLARVISPIRAGGLGELMFSQRGARRSAAARSEDGTAIPKGAEVIVTRYEKGIAYVRAWDAALAVVDTTTRVDR